MTLLTEDTPEQIEQIQLNMLRVQSVETRISIISQMYKSGVELELLGIRMRYPEFNAQQILSHRLQKHFKEKVPDTIETYQKMSNNKNFTPFSISGIVIDTFNDLRIPYFIGGSIASSLHGEPRYTYDADIVAQMTLSHVDSFFNALKDEFYLDRETIVHAIEKRLSFNIIHFESAFKVDVFISQQRSFELSRFKRRVSQPVEERIIDFSSVEDIILAKLEWYKMGGESSDKQWRDILGILLIQKDHLDIPYLKRWSQTLDVFLLLSRAFQATNLRL